MNAVDMFGPLPAGAAPGQQQANSNPERDCGDPNKYIVGRILRLVSSSDPSIPPTFPLGSLLVVAPQNHCGMGIDCYQLGKPGRVDMVWPEEVRIARKPMFRRTK